MLRAVRRSIFLGSMAAAIFVWAACGDDDNAAPTPDAGVDATPDAVDRTPTIVLPDDSGPDDGGKVVYEAGPHDAGPIILVDGGDDYDGSIPCTVDGELEVESNDTMDTANTMNPPQTRCGFLRLLADAGAFDADAGGDGGDASTNAVEHDWMTFHITPGARDFFVQYQGDGLSIYVIPGEDGGRYDIMDPNTDIPFHPSLPYFIDITSKDGQPHTWRVTLFQDF